MSEHNEIHDIWDEQLVGMAFSFKNLLEEIYGKDFTAVKVSAINTQAEAAGFITFTEPNLDE